MGNGSNRVCDVCDEIITAEQTSMSWTLPILVRFAATRPALRCSTPGLVERMFSVTGGVDSRSAMLLPTVPQ